MQPTPEPPYPGKTRYHGGEALSYDKRWMSTRFKRRLWRAEKATLEKILERVPPKSLFLDVACGTGRNLPILVAHDVTWIAGDISRDMLQQVPESLRSASATLGLIQMDAESLPFRNGAFDYVLCFKFFHLLPLAVAVSVLTELARVTSTAVLIEVPLRLDVRLEDVADQRNGVVTLIRRSRRYFSPAVDLARRSAGWACSRASMMTPVGRTQETIKENGGGGIRRRLSEIAALTDVAGLHIAAVQPLNGSRWTVIVLEQPGRNWTQDRSSELPE